MSAPGGTARVLVIDDDEGLRNMLFHALKRVGYEPVLAEDGEKGVAAARAADFDVVICDIMMPGLNGVAVLEILKRERPLVEVMMVTGCPASETSSRCAELGAFAYLAKPYVLQAFLAVLEAAVARRRGRAGA